MHSTFSSLPKRIGHPVIDVRGALAVAARRRGRYRVSADLIVRFAQGKKRTGSSSFWNCHAIVRIRCICWWQPTIVFQTLQLYLYKTFSVVSCLVRPHISIVKGICRGNYKERDLFLLKLWWLLHSCVWRFATMKHDKTLDNIFFSIPWYKTKHCCS